MIVRDDVTACAVKRAYLSYVHTNKSIQYVSIVQSKLTAGARALVRSCRAEMGEIEACPECYAGAHARRATWFTDVCTTPHILLWAKLKGMSTSLDY